MLEKLTTHDIQDVAGLFSLADKYARAAEGRAWHAQPTPGAKPKASAAAQGGGSKDNNKKKVGGSNQPLNGAPTTAVATTAAGGGEGPRGDKRPHQASNNNDGGVRCPVHNSMCLNALPPRLGGPLPHDPSMPPWMCTPGYGGWRTTAHPMEHRAPL
jgi:hypothetical protein